MEVSNKLHHELVTESFHEDFREEDEDDEENRFIISLDDIDMKDELLDDIEVTPPESNNVEKIGQGKQKAPNVNFPRVSSLTESTNLAGASINDSNSGKSCVLFQVPKDGNSVSTDSSCQDKGVKMSHSAVDIEKGEQSFMKNIQKVNESSNHTTSLDTVIELSFSGKNSVDTPVENPISQSAPVKKSHLTTKNRSFVSQKNCSCIMCYQGRGIIDSNHIPKGAKRKVEMPPNDLPVKTKKLPSVNFHASANEPSSLQNLPNQKLSSSDSSVSSSQTIPKVNSVTKSFMVKPQIQQNLLPSSSTVLVRNSNNPSNYVFIVPSTSGSSEIKTASIGSSLRSQIVSTSGHQVNPSSLPILIPKPCIPSTVVPTVSISSVVSNLSSQTNFTRTSQSSPLISCIPSTKINTAPTEKAQVVVVNKSSLESQITDLNGILKRATKVDLSSPGIVLVHFKPTAQTSVTSSSTNMPLSPSSSSNCFPHDKVKSTSPHYMENALFGLVKNHLTQPSSSNIKQNTSKSSPVVQNDLSAKQRQSLISKPQWQYSLVNGKVMPRSLNSQKSFGAFPPPPPLTPRPDCSQSGRTRPMYDPKVILNQEEQTETLVLPLPKNYQEKSAGNLNVDKSKQDEMLLSPNLFTFSSPFELSPQKIREQPLGVPSNDSAHQSINGQQSSVSSFQNQIHSYIPISSPSSLVTHAGVAVENSSVASLSFSPEDAATQSYATHDPNFMCLTSSSSSSSSSSSVTPHKTAKSHSTGLQVQEIPINSVGHRQVFSGLGHPKISNLPPSSEKDKAQMMTGNSNVTTSLSSSASVSIVNGLKMKIRLKESMMEGKDALNHEEHRISSKSNEPLIESSSSQSISGDTSTEIGDIVVSHSSTDTTTSISETHLAGSVDKTGHVETAEEMFKRFEDQAMRQVYNAQFGVGDVHRSLRPNRTTTATSDFLYVHSRKSGEYKKKKTDENRIKSNPDVPISKTEETTGIDKNVRKIKRKRSLSGEGRQKELEEKSIKLDINQYPKLMQDNSILNRKTIYTPNILAGHKVYVKFNVFSNIQSNRSFLVPFFNIGGSRTQFDVEDIEYINRAVTEFEKEEKSCARHLLYYSREGQKAVFLRKEGRLHSNELSSKSYKKCSYILEGYKRERSKQAYEPIEEWKVDNQVQIEIDRAEQDSEINVPENQDVNDMPCEKAKSEASETYKFQSASSILKNLLAKSTPLDITQTDHLSTPLSDNNVNCEINFGGVKSASDLVIGNKKIKSSQLVPNECASHRDKVNILKKQTKVCRTYCSPPLTEKSKLVPETSYTEKLKELVMSGVLENNSSLSSSCETLQKHISTTSEDPNLSLSNENSSSFRQDNSAFQNLPNIKTEVQDDGYDFALSGKQKETCTSTNSTGVNIKSEPIDDYTESLAKRMNVLLQNDRQTLIKSALSGKAEDSGKSEKLSLKKAHILSSDNHAQSSKEQNSTNTGIVCSTNGLNAQSKDSGISLPLAVDVQKSLSNKNSEKDSSLLTCTTSADECQFSESENATDSLTNIDSSSVSESSDITSSSDVETSQEEEDEEVSSLTISCTEGSARDKSTANNKITSLVESLKQRLNQDCVAVPEFLSCSELKKKRRKKKKKRMDSISKNSREKLVASTSNSISVFPSIHSSAPLNISKQLSSYSLNITSDTTNECKNDISKSVTDSELKLSLPSTSSLSSLSILKSSSSSDVACSKKVNDKSSVQAQATFLSMGSGIKDATHKNIACSSASENLKESNSVLPLCSDHLTVDTNNVCDKINVIDNKNDKDSQFKSEKLNSVEKCELTEDSNDRQETSKKKCDRYMCSSTSSNNCPLKDILQNKGNDTRKEQVREDEVQFKQEFNSERSSPCSEIEIDVGSEEVLVESPVKKNPVPSVSLLSSPPVPSFGRRHIKDFTREHDLMLPLVTVPNLKSKLNCIIDQNIKKEEGSTPNDSSFYKTTRDSNKSAKSKYVRVLKKSPKTGLKVKPSVASILCKKLDIEVEPTIPQPKVINGTAVLSKTKIFTAEERQTPSPGNKSFNRPTLNAIFGVDNFSMPPSASEDGEEEVSDMLTVVTQQKPRTRQVAIKGTHSSKAADRTNKRLSLLKRPLKTKSCSPKNSPKEKSKTSPMKNSRIKNKSQVSSDRRGIQKQKRYNLQSFFRTWRQLSHEQKNRQNMKHEHQQVCTIPCKVVLHRIEDMHLDSNGQPVVKENISTCGNNDSTENNRDIENRFINVKKRKKRANMKISKKRGVSKDKKKDIVDYYASMLETLRKKAQLLEEEAIREEMKKAEESKSEPLIKIEPIEEQPINSNCNYLNRINHEDTEICSEQLQDKENNSETELIASQDNKIELNTMTKQIDSEILDSSSAKNANNSICCHETSKEAQVTQIEVSEKSIVDRENMDQEHTVPKKCDTSDDSNCSDKEKLKTHLADVDNVNTSALEPITSSSTVSCFAKENTQSHTNNNSYLSDSSEVGRLVIDFDSEEDHKNDTDTEGSCAEEEKKLTITSLPHDLSDLMSDSSFRTKDIVLGFENELGADTVISTLSQSDMDDMFLMEDDEDESPIGLIPEDEVEKLLGLDVTGEGEASKHEKNDDSKKSNCAPSTSHSPGNLESYKLQWTPIMEVPNGNSGSIEKNIDSQTKESLSTVNRIDESVTNLSPPNDLQIPMKKCQISPSWNRLLGSEALKKMEKSAAKETFSSSIQSLSEHQNRDSVSNGKLKLKFCAGALSRALKLSAEMKKVLSDDSAPESSTDQQLAATKKGSAGPLVTQGKKCTKDMSNSNNMDSDNKKYSSYIVKEKECIVQENLIILSEKPKTNGPEIVQQYGSNDLKQSRICVTPDCQEVNSFGLGNRSISEKLGTMSGINSSTTNEDKISSANQYPEISDVSQASSSAINVKSKSLPLNTKIIDLNKLKLKLNPFLSKSASKKKLLESSNLRINDMTVPLTSDEDSCSNKVLMTEFQRKRQLLPKVKAGSESEEVVPKNTNNLSLSLRKESLGQNIGKTDINTLTLKKPMKNSEPSLITSKLCNILKNVKKPISGPKESTAETAFSNCQNIAGKFSLSEQDHSSLTRNNRKLRSSPRLPQSHNTQEVGKSSSSLISTNKSLEESEKIMKKGDDEEKGGRSFFDCLSDVIPRTTWDET